MTKAKRPPEPETPAEQVRADFLWVYERLGGREALLTWAKENAKEFFKSFLSLVQRQAGGDGEAGEFLRALRELSEAEGD